MAKDKSEKEKKVKSEKKEKRQSTDGVDKKEKKREKKDRKSTTSIADEDVTMVDADVDGETLIDGATNGETTSAEIPLSALVPFANPLCDDKTTKKVLKTVKKAAKHKCLKRGVKEVVKAVRKTPDGTPATINDLPSGIVVLAADISPMDVISHIPVLCEDHNIPYLFLTSRAELGAAGATKRPTSVVMVTPSTGTKKKEGQEDDPEWPATYKEFHKLAVKQGQRVKV